MGFTGADVAGRGQGTTLASLGGLPAFSVSLPALSGWKWLPSSRPFRNFPVHRNRTSPVSPVARRPWSQLCNYEQRKN